MFVGAGAVLSPVTEPLAIVTFAAASVAVTEKAIGPAGTVPAVSVEALR
jgi:hypothetical protein